MRETENVVCVAPLASERCRKCMVTLSMTVLPTHPPTNGGRKSSGVPSTSTLTTKTTPTLATTTTNNTITDVTISSNINNHNNSYILNLRDGVIFAHFILSLLCSSIARGRDVYAHSVNSC
ncbi:uncharacterized protein ACRADG_008714 isoform 1-T1 [Cochliomyia hominivorax]